MYPNDDGVYHSAYGDAAADSTADGVRWATERFQLLVDNVEQVIRGKRHVISHVATCLLAEGHLLLEDVPGTGKTTLAKALANSIDGTTRRLQCTPDLLPSDVIGVQLWDASDRQFVFHDGPVFTNILLADEINRSPSKTQSALLEVMEERQVTVDSVAHPVPRPFLVIATQNPIEHSGTYKLPEAQVDRFMMKAPIGYPAEQDEMAIIEMRTTRRDADDLLPVMTTADLERMIAVTRAVTLSAELRMSIVRLVGATRPKERHVHERDIAEIRRSIQVGVSPRAGVVLARAAQARAIVAGRSYATSHDVKELAVAVLAHRLVLVPEAELQGITPESLIEQLIMVLPDAVEYVRV